MWPPVVGFSHLPIMLFSPVFEVHFSAILSHCKYVCYENVFITASFLSNRLGRTTHQPGTREVEVERGFTLKI